MPPVKKSKKKKSVKDPNKDAKAEENKDDDAPNEFKYIEQKPGWIFLELILCHVPFNENAKKFGVFMLSS